MYVQTPRQLPGGYFTCYLERTANHQTPPHLAYTGNFPDCCLQPIQNHLLLLAYEFTLLHLFPFFTPAPSITNANSLKITYLFPKNPIVRKSPPVNPRIADNYVFSNCWWFRLHGPGPGPFSGMWLNEPVWCCFFFQDNFQC